MPDQRRGTVHARRLRDLLRLAILDGQFAAVAGRLPSEAELMAEYRASRTAVRRALALLAGEGLIDRRRGLGTTWTTAYAVVDLSVPEPGDAGNHRSLAERIAPHVLHWGWLPAPRAVARRLDGVREGEPCLAIEYLLVVHGEAVAVITNYIREREAAHLEHSDFRTDFYSFLLDGGVSMGGQGSTLQPRLADEAIAPLLGVDVGSPVMAFEQVIRDGTGQVIDVALGTFRGDVRLRGGSERRTEGGAPTQSMRAAMSGPPSSIGSLGSPMR